jgi:hypothetical protein
LLLHSVAILDNLVAAKRNLPTIAFVAAAAAWIPWQLRAAQNIWTFSDREYRFRPGETIALLFIPILNFFKPYQVMSEIVKSSDPDVDIDSPQWEQASVPDILIVWWALWLMSWLCLGLLQWSAMSYGVSDLMKFAYYGIQIAQCLVAARLIQTINRNQVEKDARLRGIA